MFLCALLWSSLCFFFFWAQDDSHKKNPRRNQKELIESLVEREILKDGKPQNVKSLYDVATRVKEYKRLTKSGKQYVLNLTYQQGSILDPFK